MEVTTAQPHSLMSSRDGKIIRRETDSYESMKKENIGPYRCVFLIEQMSQSQDTITLLASTPPSKLRKTETQC